MYNIYNHIFYNKISISAIIIANKFSPLYKTGYVLNDDLISFSKTMS